MTDRGKHPEAARALAPAIGRLLAPLVRILLRYGITHRAFCDIAKHVYVQVASKDFRLEGRKQSASRISVVTGLPRKEVARVLARPGAEPPVPGERHSRIARLISAWRYERRFQDGRGRPAPLPLEGSRVSFSVLVRRHGGDIPARAALDEMLRVGAARKMNDGRIRLVTHSYVPADLEIDKFEILGEDVADLVATIDHNLVKPREEAFVQRKIAYDNIPREAAAKLRNAAVRYIESLISGLDATFAKHDRDVNPKVKGSGRKRHVVGLWYYEHDFDDDAGDDEE